MELLTPDRIFNEAAQIASEEERCSFLNRACAGDTALRRLVERLLKVNAEVEDFLESPPACLGIAPTLQQPPTEQPGTHIGPYKLLEQIGEGGMGVVYVAEQTEPVRRRVALKIIKPGMDTKQVIARFEAERQALAMMDHPHIAKVLDAGTTDAGRPYFVMELVRGLPVTEYCDKARLSPRQRLELFIDVCHAVQHAHQKGVIHRDLKPSNVMITVHDGRPVAKVIDFGVAKAVGQQLTERTVYTAHTQLVGTPLYMSPEQADFSSQDVDTRSDVYSLGVLLYELLTGQTPFDKETLTKAGFDEMRRIIREDEPPCPSRRFSTLSAQAISTVSQHRSVDERHLGRVLRGELDWIVMKALEKDRSRRYESASALAADIQRYLSDEPVLACPPTAMYRFQKFVRKHKPALFTVVAIALCLLLGTTVSAWQAVRATQAEAEANANKQKAVVNEQKANTERDEAQKQRDEVKALADKLAAKEEELQRTVYADHIHMAKTAWDSGDVRVMSQLLGQHIPQGDDLDRRGFEWRYLNRLSNIGPLVSISTPIIPMKWPQQYELRLSPDRTRLIRFKPATKQSRNGTTPATPPTLQAWNLQTGQEEYAVELAGVPDFAAAAPAAPGLQPPMPEFTPDGANLVLNTSRWDSEAVRGRIFGEVKVWETRTGKEIFKLNGVRTIPCFSPDNKLLAIPQAHQSVKIWDLQTGQERLTLQGQLNMPNGVAFSPDGKRLAAADNKWDGTKKAEVGDEIIIWDVETGEQLKSFQGQAEWINPLVFSPDGQRLVTAAQKNDSIKLWDAQTGKELMTFRWDIEHIEELRFNADGTRLIARGSPSFSLLSFLSSSAVSYAKLWNTQTGKELLSDRATEVQFSPDGKRVALCDRVNARIKAFDAQSGQIMLSLKETNPTVAFSPDSKRFAALSGGMRIWDLETGDEINHIKGFDPNFDLLAFSQDGKRLIGSSQSTTQVWDADLGQLSAKKILLPEVRLYSVIGGSHAAISSDFTRIAGTSGTNVKLFDANTGQELRTLAGHKNGVHCVAFSQDGKRIASSDGQQDSNTVKVWDAETGTELFTIAGLAHRILLLKFSPDGKKLAGTPADGTITVWDAGTKRELYGLGTRSATLAESQPDLFHKFAFSPDGKRLAWHGKIWDAATGDELVPLKNVAEATGNNIDTTAFSPDGKRVVGAIGVGSPVVGKTSPPTTNGVWDAETGELLLTTPVVNGEGCQTFSPDGKRLVGGKIWDAQTGQFLLSLGSGGTGQVVFSPDGHRLAVVSAWSNEVTIYDATPLQEKP